MTRKHGGACGLELKRVVICERERDDDVKIEWWNRLQIRKRFLIKVRRGKKDEREDRKCGPKIANDF